MTLNTFNRMSEEPYRVQVLHYLNPHQVWVRPLRTNDTGDRWCVEQVGLHGALALRCNVDPLLDRVVMEPSAEWPPAVGEALRRYFRARAVWFVPAHVTVFSHSILDNNIYKLGEFYAEADGDTLLELSQVLRDSSLAAVDLRSFTEMFDAGRLPLKLNIIETNKVVDAIMNAAVDIPPVQWRALVQDQMHVHFHRQRFESEANRTYGAVRTAEIKNSVARKEADFEFHCKGVDHDFLIGKNKSASRALKISDAIKAKKQAQAERSTALEVKAAAKPRSRFQAAKVYVAQNHRVGQGDTVDAATRHSGLEKTGELDKVTCNPKTRTCKTVEASVRADCAPTGKYKDHWQCNDSEGDLEMPASNERGHSMNVGEDSFLDRKVFHESSSSPKLDLLNSMNSLKFTPKHFESSGATRSSGDSGSQTSANGIEESSVSSNVHVSNRLKIMHMALQKRSLQANVSSTETSEHETSMSSEDKNIKRMIQELNTTKLLLMKRVKARSEQKKLDRFESIANKIKEPPKRLIQEIVQPQEKITDKNDIRPKRLIEEITVEPQNILTVEDESSNRLTNKIDSHVKEIVTDIVDLDSPIKPDSIPVKSRPSNRLQLEPRNYEIIKQDHKADFIEKIVTPQLMIHSKNNIRIKPITELKNIHFTNKIHKILLETGKKTPMSLQTVSWPCILRGHSFFSVSPRGSGKSMGYIPAVCRLVVDNNHSHNSGPVCIIICDAAKSVDEVVFACNSFLKGDKTVLFCYAGVDKNQLTRNMLNGCDILVSTPFHLCDLFRSGHFSLDLSCLSIVVLDGCDRINNLYSNEFKFFYTQVNKMLSIRVNKHHQIQYIATSNEWCNLMLQLSMKASNSVVCIGSYHECVVYSKAHTSVVFDMVGSKVDTVLDFMKEVDASKRTVIVCNTNSEVTELEKTLTALNYTVLTGGTDLSIQQVYNLNQSWFQYDLPCVAPILVCCDENLRYLKINNAHYLVHFSLPATFTSFCKRFTVLIDHYNSIFEDDLQNKVKIKILIDSNNMQELPKLLNFMKRCTKNIPEVLNEISEKILTEKDKAKAMSYTPLCDNLISLGECPDFWYCNKRHTIYPLRDTPAEWVPKKGIITFEILHYHSAVHYSAEVTSYIVDGKKTVLPSNASKKIAMKLNTYFCNENNKKLHGVSELGDICATSTSPGYYERCQVVRILSYYNTKKPKLLAVNLIDEEKEHIVTDVELFHLPEKFKIMLSHVVQIRLGGIRPKDKDVSFSDMSKNFLMRLIKEEGKVYLRAKIALVLGNTIIVEDLDACQDMSTTSDTVVRCKVMEALCSSHAEPSKDHLPKLEQLCEAGGLTLPKDDVVEVVLQKEVRQHVKPQWAHLESDDFPLIYFSSAENPGKFYVRLVRFEACLDKLTKDIKKHIESVDQHEAFEFQEGDLVLAKFPDDAVFYRARIDSFSSEDINEKIKCFFVDHGDWRMVSRGDVREIPESFITVLPLQAIECRLIGLQPPGEDWNDWSTNYFIELCFQDPTDDSLRELYVKYSLKERAESTGGYKYALIMIDTSSDEDIIINDVMLNANMAVVNEAEKGYLENIMFEKPKTKDHSDSEDSDIIDEEWRKEAKPYKHVKYERKLDFPFEDNLSQSKITQVEKGGGRTIEKPSVSSFDSDAFDAEFSDDECFVILGMDSKRVQKKLLPQLTAPNEQTGLSEDESTKKSESIGIVSSCSSFEAVETPKIKELDSDDLSSPEDSVCQVTVKTKNIDLVESPKKDLNKSLDSRITDNQNNGKRTPRLSWHQTKTMVIVKIEIGEVEDYKLDIDRKSMTFETYAHDTQYGFTISFYGGVVPSKCSHSSKGLYILIKLAKLLNIRWSSLAEGEKKRWITYNPDCLEAESSDDGDADVVRKDYDDFLKERAKNMDDEEDDDFLDERDDVGDYP